MFWSRSEPRIVATSASNCTSVSIISSSSAYLCLRRSYFLKIEICLSTQTVGSIFLMLAMIKFTGPSVFFGVQIYCHMNVSKRNLITQFHSINKKVQNGNVSTAIIDLHWQNLLLWNCFLDCSPETFAVSSRKQNYNDLNKRLWTTRLWFFVFCLWNDK